MTVTISKGCTNTALEHPLKKGTYAQTLQFVQLACSIHLTTRTLTHLSTHTHQSSPNHYSKPSPHIHPPTHPWIMPPRIPSQEDFSSLPQNLKVTLHFPSPPESTSSLLLLFHGLGDNDASFAHFAASINLPGVLAISVRGTSPLPPYLLPDHDPSAPTTHFHWGDDLRIDPGTGGLDPDPGFDVAKKAVMTDLLGEIVLEKLGWERGDVLLFGFGQGGSLALGLASMVRMEERVVDVEEEEEEEEKKKGREFKGVVSIGGGLPGSLVPTVSAREKSKTPVLVCAGRESEVVDEDAVDVIQGEFETVKVVRWKGDDGMPRSRDEVLPLMEFFAARLNAPLGSQ